MYLIILLIDYVQYLWGLFKVHVYSSTENENSNAYIFFGVFHFQAFDFLFLFSFVNNIPDFNFDYIIGSFVIPLNTGNLMGIIDVYKVNETVIFSVNNRCIQSQ